MAFQLGLAYVEVAAHTEGLEGAFKKIEGGVHNLLHSFSEMSPLIGVITGVVGLSAALSEFMSDAKSAIEVETRLEAVIKATGHSAGITSEEVIEMSEKMMHAGTNTTTSIQAATTRLLMMGAVSKETLPEVLSLAEDVAAQGFGTMETAASTLGRALSSPANGMNRLRSIGIIFTKEEKKKIANLASTNRLLEAQAEILKKVKEAYGGSAKAFALTPIGAYKHIKSELEEISTTIGKYIWPYAVDIAKAALLTAQYIKGWAVALFEVDKFFGRWPGRIILAAAVLFLIPGVVKQIVGSMTMVWKTIELSKTAWTTFGNAIYATWKGPIVGAGSFLVQAPSLIGKIRIAWAAFMTEVVAGEMLTPLIVLVAVAAVIAAIVASVYVLYRYFKDVTQVQEVFTYLWDVVVVAATAVGDAIWEMAAAWWEFFNAIVNPFAGWMPTLDKIMTTFTQNLIPSVVWFTEAVAHGIITIAAAFIVLAHRFAEFNLALAELRKGNFSNAAKHLSASVKGGVVKEIGDKMTELDAKAKERKRKRDEAAAKKGEDTITLDIKDGFVGFADAWKTAQEAMLKTGPAERTAQGVMDLVGQGEVQGSLLGEVASNTKGLANLGMA